MADEKMDFSAFMAENVIQAEPVEFAVSKRFHDKDGEAVKWKIRPFSAEENDRLIKSFTKKIRLPNGERSTQFDKERYMVASVVKAVIYPNLNDADLQDSYGVMSAEELVKKMLLPGEFDDLANAVAQALGFETSVADDVETAKN